MGEGSEGPHPCIAALMMRLLLFFFPRADLPWMTNRHCFCAAVFMFLLNYFFWSWGVFLPRYASGLVLVARYDQPIIK